MQKVEGSSPFIRFAESPETELSVRRDGVADRTAFGFKKRLTG